MSKINNITKYIIPFLNKVFEKDLIHVTNSWYLDNRKNLYKILLYEDDYLISSDTEYPEVNDISDNKYINLNIYLKKVNRSEFISSKKSFTKFSFSVKNNVYHYLCDNFIQEDKIFSSFQIDSRKRKRSYSEDEIKKNKKYKEVDWSKMVSASKVRNYLLNDTLIDWLNEYNVTSIDSDISKIKPVSSSSVSMFRENNNVDEFTKHIMEQGNIFEKEVIKILSKKIKIVQASESFQAREMRNFRYTKELMKEGVPVIFQGVLHNYENKTYGCPDLLVRSDYLNKLFNQELLDNEELKNKGVLLGKDYYYIVVDIKHSTLHFNVDFKTLRNRDSVPAYKGQLYIYNQALSKVQGHNPMKAFILGKTWQCKENTGTNFLEKLGTIDYSGFDSNFVEQTEDAIKWVLRVRQEGHKWKLLPLPSIPELYPNMNNERDGSWKVLKKELADNINEITSLWMCGVKNRIIAHGNKIYSYKDEECSSELLGFKPGKIYHTLNQIIEINRNENNLIIPKNINTSMIGNLEWRTINESSLEFYLDYETMNSNLGEIFIENDNIGYQNNQFIFQIGLGYEKNKKWIYKSFVAPTNDLTGEFKMINSFWKYVREIMEKQNKETCHFVHWYNAEPISYNKLQKRISSLGSSLPNKIFLDLYQLFRVEPIAVNGALNYSLKSIAKAMNKHSLIKTSWDSRNPCSNGLNAMLLAHKAYKDTKEIMDEKNFIMKDIIHYNEVDCKVLWEIINYLRENN
mgnify:CR=1 FL=1|tara:strand:+ start:471 stop:2696 length:2226 start_codon:yes stop_codon:yes gene_type:complete